ncbi:MAG: hypothetical protein RL150_45 [Candidatus Parcubacteria bacterium]|jgi:type II secretory pathway component PulF
MKQRLANIVALMTAVLLPTLVQAQVQFTNPIRKGSIQEILTAVLDFLTAIGAILAVLFTVYAGFLFVTARGNEGQLGKAKQTLFWTLVGAVIVLGAFVLAEVIETTANQIKG